MEGCFMFQFWGGGGVVFQMGGAPWGGMGFGEGVFEKS